LSIVPVKAPTTPACVPSHAARDKVIEYPEWRGYFKGAKRNLVFLYASDGTNGGLLPLLILLRFPSFRSQPPRLSMAQLSAGQLVDEIL
jgi:hypothetical protein